MRTGTDALRLAMRSRKMAAPTIARYLGIVTQTLQDFADGKANLPPDKLQALATYIFGGHIAFNPVANVLLATAHHIPTGMVTPPVAPLGPQYKNEPIAHSPRPNGRENKTADAYPGIPDGFA